MKRRLRSRFWVESLVSAVSAGLALITLLSRHWIEIVFRTAPDHHNGSLEMVVVGASLAVVTVLGVAARVEWRRAEGLSPRSASPSLGRM